MSNDLSLRLDPIGGIAGDMFCAALLDAYPRHLDGLRNAIAALDPPEGWSVELEACLHPIRGSRFKVRLPNKPASHHRPGDVSHSCPAGGGAGQCGDPRLARAVLAFCFHHPQKGCV